MVLLLLLLISNEAQRSPRSRRCTSTTWLLDAHMGLEAEHGLLLRRTMEGESALVAGEGCDEIRLRLEMSIRLDC
jgi:hypothetical protein